MARNKVQDALRQRKRSEAEAAMANGPPEEGAYQCFFNRDDLPSPMESGTLCDFPLAQLSGFPDHEEHFPLYTGARLEDMVESIKRHGVQSPILVWKTAEGTYIIISGHNRVNASKIAGLTTIPAVIRTDLTQETAEDLFYEMNFRQRSLADMLFSQRVLCIAAHYNMLKRQGRRTDLQTSETTSPDTQEKSHTDVKIAQEYELTRDKVSKYCRYATLYRPLLLLMNSGKRLGQLAAYEISFVEDHSLQECIYQFISEGSASISTAKGKKLRAAFEDGKLDAGKTTHFLRLITGIVMGVGLFISILSFYILMLSIFLLLQKNTVKLENLLLIGYSPNRVALPYNILTCGLNLAVLILSVGGVAWVRSYYTEIIGTLFPQLETGTLLPCWTAGCLLCLAVSSLNIVMIRRKIMSIWKGR